MKKNALVICVALILVVLTTTVGRMDALAQATLPQEAGQQAEDQQALRVGATLGPFESEEGSFLVDIVVDSLEVPSSLSFLPDGKALVTERPRGRMHLLDVEIGTLTQVQNMPAIHGKGDSGLHDVLVHPEYAQNGWIYFSYSILTEEGVTVVADRARLDGTRLVDRQRLFIARPFFDTE